MEKVLLINFCGHILTTNTFIPDGSLAVLAATLFQRDIPVEIIDLQNPRDIGKVLSAPTVNRGIGKEIADAFNSSRPPSDDLIASFNYERANGEDYLLDKLYEKVALKIEKEKISIIGFKLWIGGTLKRLVRIAEKIKENYPDVTLIAGGPALHYLGDLFKNYTNCFDFLIPKEGEDQLLEIIARKSGKSFNFYQGDLRTIPQPMYSQLIYPNIDSFFKLRMIDDSRGCFNSCAFCSHPYFSGQKVRMRKVVDLVDEMEKEQQEDGIDYFRFSGSNPPWRFVVAVAEEIIRRNLKLNYSLFSSFNNCRVRDIPLLRKSGLRAIFFGIESASADILKRAHEKNNISNDHVIMTCQACMSEDIFVTLSLVYPSPYETEETKKENLDLISKIFAHSKLGSVMVFPSFLGPGSSWWRNMDKYGFKFIENFSHDKYLLKIVDHHFDVLLPKSAIKDIGYTLGGKTVPELFVESSHLTREIQKLGIVTDFDDSAYMMALMGKTTTQIFQKEMLTELLIGNEVGLQNFVNRYNGIVPLPKLRR